jgi:hypothetical protein
MVKFSRTILLLEFTRLLATCLAGNGGPKVKDEKLRQEGPAAERSCSLFSGQLFKVIAMGSPTVGKK